jgi:hypothetical protein
MSGLSSKNDIGSVLYHVPEVPDGLINCQKLVIVWAVVLLLRLRLREQNISGCQASSTNCCKVAPTAKSEVSVMKARVADGSGCASRAASERLDLQ